MNICVLVVFEGFFEIFFDTLRNVRQVINFGELQKFQDLDPQIGPPV